jgi:hypothetical protein
VLRLLRHEGPLSRPFFARKSSNCLRNAADEHGGDFLPKLALSNFEDIGENEPLIAKPRRALAGLPPDMANAALLAGARLVLEEQADALIFVRTLNVFQQLRSPF